MINNDITDNQDPDIPSKGVKSLLGSFGRKKMSLGKLWLWHKPTG